MKDKKYFDKNEENDMKMLYDFNLHTNLFSGLEPTEYSHFSDATAYTVSKFGEYRKYNIEIKNRNAVLLKNGKISGATFIDDTIIIESHKACDLMLDNINGYEPLYINFLDNNVVVIYNLNKLSVRPTSMKKFIKSNGYQGFEIASRQGLNIKDAAIYKDYKLVKRIGEEWKITQQ